MIHFSCDRCKRPIDSENDLRYVVRLEVEAVMDPLHEDESQGDRDHLLEIDEILDRVDAADCPEIGDDVYQKRRFRSVPQLLPQVHSESGRPRKEGDAGIQPELADLGASGRSAHKTPSWRRDARRWVIWAGR